MAAEPDPVFILPDLGEGLRDAEIVAWHVNEGDHVTADQPLVSVETDKAVVEVPSPRSGRIARLLAPVHARVPVGAPLVAFAAGGEQDTGTVVGELAPAPAQPAAQPGVMPTGQSPAVLSGRSPTVLSGRSPAVLSGRSPAVLSGRSPATPAVRALAVSLGVDLAGLAGSGPDGAITRADVRLAATSGGQPAAGMEPLHGVRRAMALRMAEAGAVVVPATLTDEADIDAWPPGTRAMPMLVVALAAACRAEAALNAAYDGKAVARQLNRDVHVGIAMDTEAGLIVPVLRDAQRLNAAGIAGALDQLEAEVRTRRIAPEQLRGATITLSNFGALGGQFATLVVVPPQVAILGVGRAIARVVAHDGGFAARRMLPLSLTFDHRAVSGGEAARFLAAVKAALRIAA